MNEDEINQLLKEKPKPEPVTNPFFNNVFNNIKTKELKNRWDIISISVLGIMLVLFSIVFIIFSDTQANENKPNKQNIISGNYTKIVYQNYTENIAKNNIFKNFLHNTNECLKVINSLGAYKADFIYAPKNDEYQLYYPNRETNTVESSKTESSQPMQEVKKGEILDADSQEDFKIDINNENMLTTTTTTISETSQEESSVQEQTTTIAISAPNVTVTTPPQETTEVPEVDQSESISEPPIEGSNEPIETKENPPEISNAQEGSEENHEEN